ncbi:MAG: FAD-dependent oxidoreductase [Geminicoccaceae bacterium]
MTRYTYSSYPYRKPPELDGGSHPAVPVIIVGAGPVGLAAAIDLALHDIRTVVLDDNDVVSVGSRAICWSKRSLEIFDRLGVGERMVDKGITWKVGRLFHRDREVYSFDLQEEPGHKMPAFINLQQYHVEQFLVERALEFPDLIDIRWKNRVTGIEQQPSCVRLAIETPDGAYTLESRYALACDGANSSIRGMMGLDFDGRAFEEHFLIADIEMDADLSNERLFWFEPTFHSGQSALLHKQPDNIYRIDLQLGPDADPAEERKPERVTPRVSAMLGGRPFEIDWVSVYTFQCRRMKAFVHDRIIFAGDSAHVVSPFGARGGNSGIQDIDNLCWKLAAVLLGRASRDLLKSYDEERCHGADENILHSSRSTSFMTPKSKTERLFRDAVLHLAGEMPFARRLVNSGRLSEPCSLTHRGLQRGQDMASGRLPPGTPCPDAPVETARSSDDWLLGHLGGEFRVLHQPDGIGSEAHLPSKLPALIVGRDLKDREGLLRQRYALEAGVTYLVRPDQHIAAAWNRADAGRILDALELAGGQA